jgi:hypothetical protein
MTKRSILNELCEIRAQLLAEADGTLDGLVAQLQRDERQGGREFARPKVRPLPTPQVPAEVQSSPPAQGLHRS